MCVSVCVSVCVCVHACACVGEEGTHNYNIAKVENQSSTCNHCQEHDRTTNYFCLSHLICHIH